MSEEAEPIKHVPNVGLFCSAKHGLRSRSADPRFNATYQWAGKEDQMPYPHDLLSIVLIPDMHHRNAVKGLFGRYVVFQVLEGGRK